MRRTVETVLRSVPGAGERLDQSRAAGYPDDVTMTGLMNRLYKKHPKTIKRRLGNVFGRKTYEHTARVRKKLTGVGEARGARRGKIIGGAAGTIPLLGLLASVFRE